MPKPPNILILLVGPCGSVALAAALVFLDLDGVHLSDHEGRLYARMMAVARGEKDKSAIAHTFRELAGP